MIEIYGYSIMTIPIISALVYGFMEFFKYMFSDGKPKANKYIPVIAALLGGAFAVLAFFFIPELVPVASWYTALIMGMASGLSAVGVHQIKKQIEKGGGDSGS